MLKSLLKFLLAASLFFLTQNVKAQSETEPNNTKATANTVTLNKSGSGHISPAGDVDWWKVTTTSDGKLDIAVTNYSSDYINFYLYDNNGTTLLNSNTVYNNRTTTYSTDGLAAGTYYIEFTGYNTAVDTSTYSFTNTLTPAPVANDKEPDSTRAQALTLALNDSTTGHVGYYYNNHRDSSDWYKVTTTSDGLLRLTITTESSTLNAFLNFTLYDNDGTTAIGSNTAYNQRTSSYSFDGLAAGTYYVKMYQYHTTDYVSYVLADSSFAPPVANDKEPDSTRAQALTLALNDSTTGHVGYYYNNHRDSSDWYKVTTTSDGILRLTITTESSTLNAYLNFTLYDNDGTTAIGSNTAYNQRTSSYSFDGLAAGTYYVKMYQYHTNDYVSYVLADSSFAPPVANDKEPNNSKATADSLPVNGRITGHVGYYYNNLRDSADWYRLTTNTDGDVRLTITTEPSTLNAYLNYTLYDNDGVTVLSSNTAYNQRTSAYNIDGLAKGTYYLKIYQYHTNDYVSYVVQDSLLTYQYAADSAYEPNKYAAQAKTILSDRTTTGHFGFYYNQQKDTTDWFKINYTGTSDMSLVYKHLSHISDGGNDYTNFYVYKDTSASPIYQTTFYTGDSYTVNLTGLSEGYYYVKITQYNSNDFEAYSLLDSFVQVDKAKISINSTKTTINSSSCGTDSITYNLSASHSPYTVRLYKNDVLYDSVITTASTTTFKGLSAGSYYATVYGDGATDAAYSKSTTSTVTPPVPAGLATTNIGVHMATISWTKLSCANYYTVQYRMVGTQTWTVINTKGDTSKLALTGLQPYTLYVWEVASVDTAKGLTFMSAYDSLRFTTLSDTAHIKMVFKGNGSACNSDTLKYKSTNSAAPYTVTLYRNGTVYGSPLSVKDTASFYNVPPGNYYAKSTGTGSGGSFGVSDTTQIVPPAPTGLDTTGVTTTMATLNWDPVSCANYYTVEYQITGAKTWTMISSATNSIMLNDLTPDTKYTWRVSALDSFNKQTVTSVYSGTAMFKTESVLPVTFVSFDGKLQNDVVVLNWSTASEINNKGYEVQRSTDGQSFKALDFVNGHNNSSQINNYTYTDEKMNSGSNYYRLKQIDNDGKFSYSSVIKIDYSKFDWSVLGNPVVNSSWLQLQLDRQAHIAVQIISISGKALQLIDKGNLNAGTYSIPLNLNNAASGMYVIKLFVNDKSYSKKIIK